MLVVLLGLCGEHNRQRGKDFFLSFRRANCRRALLLALPLDLLLAYLLAAHLEAKQLHDERKRQRGNGVCSLLLALFCRRVFFTTRAEAIRPL